MTRALGPYCLAGAQYRAFAELMGSNLSFSRLAWSRPGPAGRGLHTLEKLISELETYDGDGKGAGKAFDPGALAVGALQVVPDRVALPEVAGTIDPVDWLPADMSAIFTDYEGRRERCPLGEEPRSCHMVSAEDELY